MTVRAGSAVDAATAVIFATFMALMSQFARVTQPEARPPTAFGLALLVVCGLALALRRRNPLFTFTLAVGTAVAYLGWRFAGWPIYLGAFAGLLALVSGVTAVRVWVPFATVGGVAMAVATGPPEGWQPAPMITIAVVWAAVTVLAARATQVRRKLAEEEAAGRVVEERLRIARELHDVLSHSLATISLQAGVGLHLVDDRPEQAREALQAIRQVSNDALAQARAALSVVRGPSEESRQAPPALADLGALVTSVRGAGLGVDLAVDLGSRAIPDVISATAYRIVQEALTNVMRHAGPGARARTHVGTVDGWLEIDVTDDGIGAAVPGRSPGHGLHGLAERARAVGGELQAGPASGGGFTLHARLPLGAER
ncbi:sensor histidine kinase [Planotetraspora kaengkrachanensis]|uniref:histidine kinase n=1 Tax=Planotetraspora kaengkrachanensis TaxID=575193 RepID=A0A8J3VC77_9ACTN|nr:two-component sensor histidine kinase [Planotetraspora kaengkrachanensis]